MPTITLSSAAVGVALGRAHREHAARQALARVVVGVAVQDEGDPRRQPGAERLARPSRGSGPRSRPSARPSEPWRRGDVAGEDAAHGAVDVADLDVAQVDLGRRARSPGGSASTSSQSSASSSTGGGGSVRRRGSPGLDLGHGQEPRQVDAARLPVVDRLVATSRSVRPIRSSIVRTPRRGHDLARLLGHHHQVVDDVLGRSGEAPAQLRVLRGHARPGTC